jgi:hypothetical protein
MGRSEQRDGPLGHQICVLSRLIRKAVEQLMELSESCPL